MPPIPAPILAQLETEALQQLAPEALNLLASLFHAIGSHVQNAANTHPASQK